jgi:hypothetical protein
LVFAFYLALIVERVAILGKVRSLSWISRAGGGIGLVGWYCQWAAWSAILLRERSEGMAAGLLFNSIANMAAHPDVLVSFAIDVSRFGTGHTANWHLAGIWLVVIWLIELLIVVSGVSVLGRMRIKSPFCEASGKWAEKIKLKRKFTVIKAPAAAAKFIETDPHLIVSVVAPWREDGSPHYAGVTLYRCDGGDSYITISNHVAGQGRQDKVEWAEQPVVEFLRLPGIDPKLLIEQLESDSPTINDNAEGPAPAELAAAVEHLEGARHEAALSAALPYIVAQESGLRSDANRIAALACSRLGRWSDAVNYWEALFGDEPSAHNEIQVASSAVMAGDLRKGMSWLARARARNATFLEMPDVVLLTNFVTALSQSGKVAAAMPYLDEIKLAYTSLGATDPTVLFSQRMPNFSSFLEKSEPIVRAALDVERGRNWYLEMITNLDERGKSELSEWLANHFAKTPLHACEP